MDTPQSEAPGTTFSPPRQSFRSCRRPGLVATVLLVVAVAGCNGVLPAPSAAASQGQTMLDLADALNQIRDQSASLQDQVDSLRDVIFRQDTIIRQLALTAGIPVPAAR